METTLLFIVTVTFDLITPKINRVLPLPQGSYVTKFGKDPIYRTKVIVWKPVYKCINGPDLFVQMLMSVHV